MQEIPLTQGRVALVDAEDFERLTQWSWCFSHGYAVRGERLGGTHRLVYMHRHVLGLKSHDGCCVDHVNGNGLDNRRCNLRVATQAENNRNRRATPCRHKGISFDHRYRRPWRARIMVARRTIELGRFATAEQAARAYDRAAREHFGEFALLNFPERTGA